MEDLDITQIAAAREELNAKGACCLRGVFTRWVDTVRVGLEESSARPSRLSKTWQGDTGEGKFFQDGFAWRHVESLRKFVFESPAARVVATLMNSSTINLYMDHLLIREPMTNKETPWHHDTPYCFVDGDDFCTIWLPLDAVPLGQGLRLVSGSHRWGKMFLPVEFASAKTYAYEGKTMRDVVPDIDADPQKYEILSWQTDPGDCVVFYCSMLHSAPPHLASGRRRVYSTRWTGDRAKYAVRPWQVPPLPIDSGLHPGDPIDGELFPRVL